MIELKFSLANNVCYIDYLITLFEKLIELKNTFLLTSWRMEFDGKYIRFGESKCKKMISLLHTKLTEFTSIFISPLSIAKSDSNYLKFWFNDPFGECIVPKYNKKGKICINDRNVSVVKYQNETI